MLTYSEPRLTPVRTSRNALYLRIGQHRHCRPGSDGIAPVLVSILCGGRRSRLRGYTDHLPKPLVRIGDQPILWHVMNLYAAAGHRDFVLCRGHKGDAIRRFVSARGRIVRADVGCVEVSTPDVTVASRFASSWEVTSASRSTSATPSAYVARMVSASA